jgi:hypothetical protein
MKRRAVVVRAAFAGLCAWAALAAAACGSGKPAPAVTVTVTRSPTPSHSATVKPSPTVAKQLAIACASGSSANAVSVIGSTGKVTQLVAPSGGPITDLQWSPDGVQLAYVHAASASGSARSLELFNVPNGKVLWGIRNPIGFAWVSPTRLIVAVAASSTTYRVNGTLKAVDLTTARTSTVKDSAGHAVTGAYPSASSDGTTIAFVHYGTTTGSTLAEQLQVYDADTLSVKTIAKGKQETGIDGDPFAYPQIAPDGSLIYVAHTGNDPGFSCTVYRTDATKAFVSGYLAWPTPGAWSAAKGSLAFGGGGTGGANATISSGINVWLPGTPKAIPIVTYPNGTGVVGPMAWTPQAKQLVYTLVDTSGKADLWVIGADGSNAHLLLKHGSWPACAVAPVSFK